MRSWSLRPKRTERTLVSLVSWPSTDQLFGAPYGKGFGPAVVIVTNNNGKSSMVSGAATFQYVDETGASSVLPAVTGVSPYGGLDTNPATVTIFGSGFVSPGSADTVDFGGIPATSVTYVSPFELTVVRVPRASSIKAGLLTVPLSAVLMCAGLGSGTAGASGVTGQPRPVEPRVPLGQPARGPGPGYTASIGMAQNGRTVCVSVGEKLMVLLSTPASSSVPWSPIHVAPPGVLAPAPMTLMPHRNVTAQDFLAVHPGTAQLSSHRPARSPPPKSQVACGALLYWEVTVVVQAPRKVLPPTHAG